MKRKINDIELNDRRLSIKIIAEMVNINKEIVAHILHNHLRMTKVCKNVPKIITRALRKYISL